MTNVATRTCRAIVKSKKGGPTSQRECGPYSSWEKNCFAFYEGITGRKVEDKIPAKQKPEIGEPNKQAGIEVKTAAV